MFGGGDVMTAAFVVVFKVMTLQSGIWRNLLHPVEG